MIDFTKKFADLLENAYNGSEMESETMPITSIARSGLTDAKVNSNATMTRLFSMIQTHAHISFLKNNSNKTDMRGTKYKFLVADNTNLLS